MKMFILVLSLALLLCACVPQEPVQTDPTQNTTAPSESLSPTETDPTDPPTEPPTEAPLIQLSTNWMVKDRTVVPFEERFEADIPFSMDSRAHNQTYWLALGADGSYGRYQLSIKSSDPGILSVNDPNKFQDATLYEIPVKKGLTEYGVLIADGHWAYLTSSRDLIKVDLLSGDCTTLVTQSKNANSWQVRSCGKDTVCIFEFGEGNTMRVFYRDLHSDAEKVLYEGTIPATPAADLRFIAPETTLGEVTWQMMNPAFWAAVQAELQNPDSQFKTIQDGVYAGCWTDPKNNPVSITDEPFLCIAIQDHYNIPARVKYIYDIKTGQLTEDYGIIDGCERGSGDYNDHFNYENTRETPLDVLSPAPKEVPNLTKLTSAQAEQVKNDAYNSMRMQSFLFSEFGYGKPYLNQEGNLRKLTDIEARGITSDPYYVYCITAENTVVQISPDGSTCNTIYTSDGILADLCYLTGSIYFKDDNQIIRIDTVSGTYCAIAQSKGTMRVDSFGEEGLYILVVQGLYNQQYFFDPDTGVLKKTSFN